MVKLKCWKKDRSKNAWFKSKSRLKEFPNPNRILVEMNPISKKFDIWELRLGKKKFEIKGKKNALKYVNSYMKKHDKC